MSARSAGRDAKKCFFIRSRAPNPSSCPKASLCEMGVVACTQTILERRGNGCTERVGLLKRCEEFLGEQLMSQSIGVGILRGEP